MLSKTKPLQNKTKTFSHIYILRIHLYWASDDLFFMNLPKFIVNMCHFFGRVNFFFFFFFFCIFWGAPKAYGGSQARCQIRAVAASLCHLNHSSPQCQILNPLSEARVRTCILMDTSQILFHWAKTGTPEE